MKKNNRTYKKLKRMIILALIAVVIGIGIWWFFFRQTYDEWGIPTGNVSYEFVSSRPEARLYYPGSKEYSTMGQSSRTEGFAHAGAVLTSKASPKNIYDWYSKWLISNGWKYDDHAFAGLIDTQLSLRGYTRGNREKFYVAIDNPKTLGWTLGKTIPAGVTVFEIRYFINPIQKSK